MNTFIRIFGALNKAKVQYLVVGGVAVNLYGYRRMTGDIDILLALDDINLARMEKLMKKLGYMPRLPIELKELGDRKKLRKWMRTKNLKAYTFLSSAGLSSDLDIVLENSFDFLKHYKKRRIVKLKTFSIPVVSIEDLIAMKKKAGRDQDLLDLEALFNLKALWQGKSP